MNGIKRMSAKEFRQLGLLQEVNRLLLHPIGLALEVIVNEDGTESFGQVWDYREDPDGMRFHDSTELDKNADSVKKMFEEKRVFREKNFGYHVQPPKKAVEAVK